MLRLAADPAFTDKVLAQGAEKARAIARPNIDAIKDILGPRALAPQEPRNKFKHGSMYRRPRCAERVKFGYLAAFDSAPHRPRGASRADRVELGACASRSPLWLTTLRQTFRNPVEGLIRTFLAEGKGRRTTRPARDIAVGLSRRRFVAGFSGASAPESAGGRESSTARRRRAAAGLALYLLAGRSRARRISLSPWRRRRGWRSTWPRSRPMSSASSSCR